MMNDTFDSTEFFPLFTYCRMPLNRFQHAKLSLTSFNCLKNQDVSSSLKYLFELKGCKKVKSFNTSEKIQS